MTKKHNTTWAEFKDEMLSSSEAKAAYDEAERAWQLKEVLIEAREQAQLTKAELARKLDLAPSNLNRLEKHPDRANIQTLFKYMDACGVKLKISFSH